MAMFILRLIVLFKIGDRVTFYPSGHEPQTGTLTRFNRKSVTVITDNGGHWNVAPTPIEFGAVKGLRRNSGNAAVVKTFER
ncbi:MAG: hypothetical protein HQM16_06450 [Deltaproteobacteria bacterium]|nr:hypothetical protein [Deltaproteobacteria bacterium]